MEVSDQPKFSNHIHTYQKPQTIFMHLLLVLDCSFILIYKFTLREIDRWRCWDHFPLRPDDPTNMTCIPIPKTSIAVATRNMSAENLSYHTLNPLQFVVIRVELKRKTKCSKSKRKRVIVDYRIIPIASITRWTRCSCSDP